MKELDLDSNDDRIRAWKSAKAMAYLCTSVSFFTVIAWHFARNTHYWQWSAATVVHLILLLAVKRDRQHPIWLNASIFVTAVIVSLFANTLTNYQLALGDVKFDTFTGYKIIPLAVALIAPSPVWIGYVLISVTSIFPIILYFFVFPTGFAALISIQEPWLTTVYGIVGFFVLRHRYSNIKMERAMSRLTAERRAVQDLAQIFLGFRDMMNTPLQSIELTASLLRNEVLSSKDGAMHLERSLIRLRELSQILTSYEGNIDWNEAGSSFDAVALLEQKLKEMRPQKT